MNDLMLLNQNAVNLGNRFEGINNWIKENINTAPNFREMIDCTIEYGKLVSQYDAYYRENGYPVLENGDRCATHYEIPVVSPAVKVAQERLHEMMRLRGKHEFFYDETAREFIQELGYRAEIAEYHEPEDQAAAAAKKDALCIAAGVYFYIWETKKREPWYQYDNVSEWNDLNSKYALYKESVGVQEVSHHDGQVYQGPQFGEVLEAMISGIEKNYAFREDKVDIVEETVGTHK